ncbi:MAG: rhodanese-like domain-containing protein [Chitinophagales bacterium]|nr:rhodanese-like domain-containing protein [Chitinophagales bacterium]
MFDFLKSTFSKSYEDLGGTDFKKKFEATKNAALLDVRTAGEFSSGTIKGAKNIDFMAADFAKKIEQLDKSKEYFLFCRSGNRSGKACELMSSKGFKTYNLASGIGAWR